MSAAELRRDTVWWGWGREHDRPELDETARRLLAEELGERVRTARAALEEVELPEPQSLPARVLGAAGGDRAASTVAEDRVRHAVGSGYQDLVRLRAGGPLRAPDAVLAPADAASIAAVLSECSREHVAVVPFGGGTSVVGGVEPESGDLDRLVSLDLSCLRSVRIDPRSQTARLGPGLRGARRRRR